MNPIQKFIAQSVRYSQSVNDIWSTWPMVNFVYLNICQVYMKNENVNFSLSSGTHVLKPYARYLQDVLMEYFLHFLK